MKLDLDVVRGILLQVEATPANQTPDQIVLEGVSEDTIVEHIELLAEHGMLEARFLRSGRGGGRIAAASIIRMTWAGHDFLSNARNQSVWAKAKALIVEKGGSTSIEVVKAIVTQVALQHFRVNPA